MTMLIKIMNRLKLWLYTWRMINLVMIYIYRLIEFWPSILNQILKEPGILNQGLKEHDND